MSALPSLAQISQLPLNFEGRVGAEHLDFLGHMNVMWYTHFFDRATWNWYNAFGFGHDYHQPPDGSFAVEQYTRYLAELREGEEFRICSRALARNEKLFHFMHFMVRSRDNALSAIHELLGIHVDMVTRKASPLPQATAQLWDQLLEEHNQLDWEPPISGALSVDKNA